MPDMKQASKPMVVADFKECLDSIIFLFLQNKFFRQGITSQS
ncbi:hypothetical protein [Streptococcus sp. HF-1907]|nr:hypothetical protein [Streptococcus sp. HF-1907]